MKAEQVDEEKSDILNADSFIRRGRIDGDGAVRVSDLRLRSMLSSE